MSITSSSSSKRVIFECTIDSNWAVCWSSKRNQLYYYNRSSKESFWEKPNLVFLTDREKTVIKEYEETNGDLNGDNEKMDTSDSSHSEEFKKQILSDETYNMYLHETSVKKVFDSSKKSGNVMETKLTNGNCTYENRNNANSSFKTPLLKYKSPLHNKFDIPPEAQKKSFVVNTVNDQIDRDKTIQKASDMDEKFKRREASAIKSYYPKENNESELFSLNDNLKLPKSSILLKIKNSPDEKYFDSPFREQSKGNEIKNGSSDNTCRNKSDNVIKTLYAPHVIKTLYAPQPSKKQQLKINKNTIVPYGVQTQFKDKDCVDAVKTANTLPEDSSGPSTSTALTWKTPGKRKKKRQYRRLGYWYNKKAKTELLMSTTNAEPNMLLSDNFNGEDMDWEDSHTETLFKKISEKRAISSKRLQTIINKECLFNCPTLKPQLLIVCDTQILLQNYRHIKHYVNSPPSEFPAAYVIPYDVLTQIDILKDSKEESFFQKRVRDVISFLQKVLLRGHSRVIGQTAENSKDQVELYLDLESVDQSIINCCLQYQLKGFNVVLHTIDPVLLSFAKLHNISIPKKKELIKEIRILSIMNLHGFLDDAKELWPSEHHEQKENNKIPMYALNIICNHLETPLHNYLSSVLNKAMFDKYGEQYKWQERFLIKYPWKIREICVNLRHHWPVLTNSFLTEGARQSIFNIHRLITNYKKIRWTQNTTGELLDSVKVITKTLFKFFPEETNTFNKHLEECDAIYNKEMNNHKLLITTPSAALEMKSENDIESLFGYVLLILKNKSEEFCTSLNWNPSEDIPSEIIPQLKRSYHNLVLYLNSAVNILKGIEGMTHHESLFITTEEPFVNYLMLGLQSIIMLDDVLKQSNSQIITPQSVIDFYWKKKNNRESLNEIFLEVLNIHTKLAELMHLVSVILQVKG